MGVVVLLNLLHIILFFLSLSHQPQQTTAAAHNSSNSSSTHIFSFSPEFAENEGKCNIFEGKWVFDPSYPLYETSSCPFIFPEFNCQNRPDKFYQKFSWQPFNCALPRFNGEYFLNKWKGKKIMFVGDSLVLNQWQSLACMIHASLPNASYSFVKEGVLTSLTFQDYGATLMLCRTPYLVDLVNEKVGRVLKLDSIRSGRVWKNIDLLVFNSWHWWTHTGQTQPWDYIEYGNKMYKDMDRMVAYYIGLTTWGRWVNRFVDPSKTKVFFTGISPTHYIGSEWNEPQKSCSSETEPFSGTKYPAGLPPAWVVVEKVMSRIRKPVYWLDITMLSEYRKDAHPSIYSGLSKGRDDCSHWCLPGLPDTWNQLLYALLN